MCVGCCDYMGFHECVENTLSPRILRCGKCQHVPPCEREIFPRTISHMHAKYTKKKKKKNGKCKPQWQIWERRTENGGFFGYLLCTKPLDARPNAKYETLTNPFKSLSSFTSWTKFLPKNANSRGTAHTPKVYARMMC